MYEQLEKSFEIYLSDRTLTPRWLFTQKDLVPHHRQFSFCFEACSKCNYRMHEIEDIEQRIRLAKTSEWLFDLLIIINKDLNPWLITYIQLHE